MFILCNFERGLAVIGHTSICDGSNKGLIYMEMVKNSDSRCVQAPLNMKSL